MMVFMSGIILGFSVAAPVGPIGILCIRRTLTEGRMFGLISGLGAATADMIFGSLAALGLSIISKFLFEQNFWIQFIGGMFLCYLGFTITRSSKPSATSTIIKAKGLIWAYSTTFLLTITNPLTILSFVGMFAGVGYVNDGNKMSAILLISGVFIGSASWWVLLSSVFGFFQKMITNRTIYWINNLSGLLIMLFGIIVIVNLIK